MRTDEFILEDVKFTDVITRATKDYAKAKPWQGTMQDRSDKLRAFHSALCQANSVNIRLQINETNLTDRKLASLASCAYEAKGKQIISIAGKLSVVTYLHLFALIALRYTKREAFQFSLNLFKQCFPISFRRRKLRHDGMLI